MIKIIKDVNLFDHIKEYDTVLLGANIYSTMNNGLQQLVKINYPYVYEDNIATPYANPDKLGTIIESKRDGQQSFILCYIMKYPNARPDLKKDILEYESLEKCLSLVNILYKDRKIALTFLGCNSFDGNGDKDKVLEIINNTLTNLDADIYDYTEKNESELWLDSYHKGWQIMQNKGKKEYFKFIKEVKEENKNKKNDRVKVNTRPFKVNPVHFNKK